MAATSSAARPKKTLAVPPWMTTCWCGKPSRMNSSAAGTCGSLRVKAPVTRYMRLWWCGASRLRVSTTMLLEGGAISAPRFAPKFAVKCAASRA